MATVRLNTESITDWQTFHELCSESFGFPNYYGMNMDAWIECMSYLDEDAVRSRFHLAEGEKTCIEVTATESFKTRLPEVFDALVECAAFINQRYLKAGKSPLILLAFL
jgi:RNAse (barnase) inhibitor barstar